MSNGLGCAYTQNARRKLNTCQLITLGLNTFEQHVKHSGYSFAAIHWTVLHKQMTETMGWSSLSIHIFYTLSHTIFVAMLFTTCWAHSSLSHIAPFKWAHFYYNRWPDNETLSMLIPIDASFAACAYICCGSFFFYSFLLLRLNFLQFWHFMCIWLAPLMFIDSISKCLSNTCFLVRVLLIVYSLLGFFKFICFRSNNIYTTTLCGEIEIFDWVWFLAFDHIEPLYLILVFCFSFSLVVDNKGISKSYKPLNEVIFDPLRLPWHNVAMIWMKCHFRRNIYLWILPVLPTTNSLQRFRLLGGARTRFNRSTVHFFSFPSFGYYQW